MPSRLLPLCYHSRPEVARGPDLKSFIRWAGSKRQTLTKLRPLCTGPYSRYIEPFAGSASLFFDLKPLSAVLGDINSELITTMRELQRDPHLVLECLRRLPRGKSHYYRIRAMPISAYSPVEQAARFIYLNRYCFNGLYRTNRKGKFNVPYGPPKSAAKIDEATIVAAAHLLRRATLLNSDFEATLEHAQRGDLAYLDPPYIVAKRRIFADYGADSFQQPDLARLGKVLTRLDSSGVKFVITYADSSEARKLFSAWLTSRIWTKRNISGFVANRRGAYEILATNVNYDFDKHTD